jgi:uncharacterized protein
MARILIFSDIHNDAKALEKLMDIEADYYFCAGDLVTFQRGIDKMAEVLKRRASKMFLIPGNHETENDIQSICSRYGFVNIHGGLVNVTSGNIAGLGYSSPTPFNTPGEYTEEELATRLSKFADVKPLVLICHAPPLNTALDRVKEGLHAGSQAVRDFIEQHQPAHFFCGHIHEAEGVAIQMGSTRAMNVGKRGYLLDL